MVGICVIVRVFNTCCVNVGFVRACIRNLARFETQDLHKYNMAAIHNLSGKFYSFLFFNFFCNVFNKTGWK